MSTVQTLYRPTCPVCDWTGAVSSDHAVARENARIHDTDHHSDPEPVLFEDGDL